MGIPKLVIFPFLASVVITSAQAESDGFPDSDVYVGVSAGKSDFSDACDNISSCDDTDSARKIFGGIHNKNFGFEAGYVNFGEPSAPNLDTDDVWGAQMHGVGILPIPKYFSGFAKVGGLFYEGDEIDGDITWALGVGAQFNFNDIFSLRAEYEWFNDIDYLGDTSLISAGVVLVFD